MREAVFRTAVSIANLTYIYHSGTSLEKKGLEGISLQIMEGECVGIVGATGSGKTTLVQHVNGLLKPSSGRVEVEGKDLGGPGVSLAEIRQRVGLVFQYPEHQLFEKTIFDEISFVLRQRSNLPAEEIEQQVKAACASVGLDFKEFRNRSPFELSGGEKRRVALAGVLVQKPHVLILDEPTVGLDGPGKREILREIEKWHRSGKTVIIVSHAIEDLVDLADRLLVLEEGKILTTGPPAEVFSFLVKREKLKFLVPAIFRLAHDLRAEGWPVPMGTFRVDEALPVLDHLLRINKIGEKDSPRSSP